LLSLYYSDLFFFIFILYLFIFTWSFYFKLGFLSTLNFSNSSDKINVLSKSIKNINFNVILKLNFLLLFTYILNFFLFKSFNLVNWWNHFKFNNFSINIVLIILFLNVLYLFILNSTQFNIESYKYDFFFALLNLSIFLVLIFFTNTLFSFFFLLEVNSVIVFFKFLMSKTWYKDLNKSSINLKNQYNSKTFINMLFFQFWTAFFSSVLFVYVIIFLLFSFGSTEWIFLNLLNSISKNFYLSESLNFFIIILLIFAFFLKLGMTPVHLYKIEIYKGINFISIFFYTTFYFLIFFLFFLVLVLLNLNSFNSIISYIISFIILFGSFFVISLIFDISHVKAFLAYSSIINSLSFLVITLSIIY
jgi:hypothetical protein